jgi:hypothetical protein
MSTEARQLQAAESPGPQRTPAAVADNAVALSAGATLPAWSDSPRQLKQTEQLTQLQPATAPASHGGLPENLRSGIEALSGIDMSGVRVHRNSSKPAALQAHAYAQGLDIHLGPGQEKHLPHEAWHVVQQAQGRVAPTLNMGGTPVNDNPSLEQEADAMGSEALQRSRTDKQLGSVPSQYGASAPREASGASSLIAKTQSGKSPPSAEATTSTQRHEAPAQRFVNQPPGAMLQLHMLAPGHARQPVQFGREFGYYGRDGKKKSQKVVRMEEFGDRNRLHNINPDKLAERLEGEDVEGMGIKDDDIDKKEGIWRPSKEEGTARPEDPPIYQPFRKAFHEAHNIKLSLERDMADFEEFDLTLKITGTLLEIASAVKKSSLEYKASVRSFENKSDVQELKSDYFLKLKDFAQQAQDLSQRMIEGYAVREGFGDESEEFKLDLQADKNEAGLKIWRTRWWAAVQEINGLLLDLWSKSKLRIEQWVNTKKEEGLSYMKPGMVGDLDYIGSLAKGYKSAPKQYIRFMPEKFDVDANLDAPPLAVYSIRLGGQVDRGSVKSRGIEPLMDFERDVNNALFEFDDQMKPPTGTRIPGLDKDDLFEVFIRASNVTDLMRGTHEDVDTAHKKEAFSNRLQTIQDRIWWLRGRSMELSMELRDTLSVKGYITLDGISLKAHADSISGEEGQTKRTYTEGDLTFIEAKLKGFERKADERKEEK